jgi:hypothetical protein
MTHNLTHAFLNKEYRAHSEQTLFDNERILFPATQAIIEREKRINDIRSKMADLRRMLELYAVLLVRIGEPQAENVAVEESVTHSHPCIYDDCRGYMSSQWKCGLCDRHGCAHCHKPKDSHDDPSHVCNPDDVASVAEIKRDTKPCPKCSTRIHKLFGCDQMWCTNCNTAFSWNHGRVITGVIHNPHYYAFLYRQRTEGAPTAAAAAVVQARACGYAGVPHHLPESIRYKITEILQGDIWSSTRKRILDLLRNVHHVAAVEVEVAEQRVIPPDRLNLDKRKQYLNGAISEEDFKRMCLQKIKRNNRNEEIRQVSEMVRDALSDICLRMIDYVERLIHQEPLAETPIEALQGYVSEIDNVHAYANECIREINVAYSSSSTKLYNKEFLYGVPEK